MHKKLLVILLFLYLSPSVFALDRFLEECLRLGENRDRKLSLAKEQLGIANLRIFRSGRAFFPGVTFQRKTSRGKTLTNEYQSEELGVRGSQPVYEGGRLRASYRYDSLFMETAKLNYIKVKEELYYRVKSAYYELLAARSELKRFNDTLTEVKRLEAKSQIEFNVKALSNLDLDEAKNFSAKVQNMYDAARMNAELAEKKLLFILDLDSMDEISLPLDDASLSRPADITFTREECRRIIKTNNVDTKINQLYITMNEQKRKITRARVIPKLYAEGFYGQSGEADVINPLVLASVWSVSGRLSWELWGTSMEMSTTEDRTNPRELVDISKRIESTTNELKLSLFDNLNYFVEAKENDASVSQSMVDYKEQINKALYDFEKYYNEYQQSLAKARTTSDEITLKERKLAVMRKKNELYEVSTLEVMDSVYKYAETLMEYVRALTTNYLTVCEMERLAMTSLR